MAVYICPATVVAAPCAQVWQVLAALPYDAHWTGADVLHADPAGPLQPGQTLALGAHWLGRDWAPVTMHVEGVDEAAGVLELRVEVPLGITNHQRTSLAALGADACRVQFG